MADKISKQYLQHLVLICVDDSEESLRAFNWYHKFLYRKTHTVGLLNVYTCPEAPHASKHFEDPFQATDNENYQRKLHEAYRESMTVIRNFQGLCRERDMASLAYNERQIGSVGHTICAIAKEKHVMYIVMGQRALGAVQRTILSSVSRYVLHHAHQAVLIVPAPKVQKRICSVA